MGADEMHRDIMRRACGTLLPTIQNEGLLNLTAEYGDTRSYSLIFNDKQGDVELHTDHRHTATHRRRGMF